jgi:hypothetical protein
MTTGLKLVDTRREGSTVTKLSLRVAQNRLKSANYKKLELLLSDGWQRVYIDFTPDSKVPSSLFKTAGFNRSPTPPFLILTYSAS